MMNEGATRGKFFPLASDLSLVLSSHLEDDTVIFLSGLVIRRIERVVWGSFVLCSNIGVP